MGDSFQIEVLSNDTRYTHSGNGNHYGPEWGFIVMAVTWMTDSSVVVSVRHGLIDGFEYPHEQTIKEYLLS